MEIRITGRIDADCQNAEVNRPQFSVRRECFVPNFAPWSLVSALMSFAQEY